MDIKIVLEELIKDGKVEKYLNKKGLEIYRFIIAASDADKDELDMERGIE